MICIKKKLITDKETIQTQKELITNLNKTIVVYQDIVDTYKEQLRLVKKLAKL